MPNKQTPLPTMTGALLLFVVFSPGGGGHEEDVRNHLGLEKERKNDSTANRKISRRRCNPVSAAFIGSGPERDGGTRYIFVLNTIDHHATI
jgi:hypothetical protein